MGLRMRLFQLNQDKLDEIIENPEELFEIDYSEQQYNSIEIDKSWGGLKFMLSKIETSNPLKLSMLISSEQEIEGIDELTSDLYDVNFLTKEQVRELTTLLNKLTENNLKNNFDFKTMNENDVYGNPFDKTYFSYFAEYFEHLKKFYHTATKERKAVITFIS